MLILAYFAEGVVRAATERGPAQLLAVLEIALALLLFALSIGYSRIIVDQK